jgi:hypothetical protein
MQHALAKSATFVRLICVIALVMVGFAHKPAAAEPVSLRFAAYILPDGTLPTLCVTDNGSPKSDPGGVLHDHGCDACRLSGAILMPEPPLLGAQAVAFSTVMRAVERVYRLKLALYPPSSGPRAPPPTVIQV